MQKPILAAALGLLVATQEARALEGGASVYPMGAENYLVGAIPPPGWYFLNYSQYYTAGRFNDGNGNKLLPNFHLNAVVEAPRIVKTFETTLLGGTPFVAALSPLLGERVRVGGAKMSTSGIIELDLTQGIGWHLSPNLHLAIGVDEFLPMGNYSPTDLASTSLNRYAIQPVLAVTYTDPSGPQADIKMMYDFNLENSTTKYKSGNDFHFDYAAGWNFGRWTLGAGGYYEHQTTDDKIRGTKVGPDGFRIEGFAIGPNVQAKVGSLLVRAKWQHEFIARNKPQGDALWLSLVLPL